MAGEHDALVLTGAPLSIEHVEAVARKGRTVTLDDAARARVEAARKVVEQQAAGDEAIYGINTGFGSLARQRIAPKQVREVQRNLVRSHAAGVGDPLPEDVVRAMMLVLAASLARARSGVRAEVIDRILLMLNRRITPQVPSRGSVGASGDLAPLAHLALAMIGEGRVTYIGRDYPTAAIYPMCGIAPLALEAKEGLALINGTHLMAAMGALMMADVSRVQDAALCAAATAIDACRGTDRTLDPRIHEARVQPGQRRVAARLAALLAGSEIVYSHLEHDPRVQDPYSLRAAPQVMGAAFDTIDFVRGVIDRELGAVTDNPLVFEPIKEAGRPAEARPLFSPTILSGANFHGMPLAIAMDVLPIALTHLAGIAERRVNWLLAASDGENPVNVYLSPQPGLHSGLMIAQYTAAACCNELQTLCAPASVGNIPTSAGMEDYNSMGVTAAHQAWQAVRLARHVIAIELLVMVEAMDYQRPMTSGAGVENVCERVRSVVQRLTADRPPAPDIAAIDRLIEVGVFSEPLRAVCP